MRRPFLSLFFMFAVSLQISSIWAAPFPGGPSSKLASALKRTPFYDHGFAISSEGTDWKWLEDEKSTVESLDIGYQLTAEANHSPASLRLNSSLLKKNLSVEEYGKQFITEYASLGFSVLGTQTFQQNKTPGLVVDLFHRRTNKKVRQVFFIREKRVVQISCQEDSERFSQVLSQCNRWVKNFTWLAESQQKSF